jgi:hypothetical protein
LRFQSYARLHKLSSAFSTPSQSISLIVGKVYQSPGWRYLTSMSHG